MFDSSLRTEQSLRAMGQHTQFHKSGEILKKMNKLRARLYKHEQDEEYLDEFDLRTLYLELAALEKDNSTDFHDVFRTSKREPDGVYCLDQIFSEKECRVWLVDNAETIYNINLQILYQFWDKYPDGAIEFG